MRIAAMALAGALTIAGAAQVQAKDAPAAQDPKAAELVREMGLAEGGPVLGEKKGWKKPRKVVMTPMGPTEALQAAAPGVQFVVVNNLDDMVKAAADADAIAGIDNMICDERVLTAAQRAQWFAVYSAGNESCLGKPMQEMERRGVVLTNMRAVAGPVMAEHSIALAYALARSLHVSVGRQARGEGWSRNFAGSQPQALTGKTMFIVGLGGIGLQVAERAHALGMKVIATRNSSRDKPDFVNYVGLSHELPELLPQADVVVAALPLTPATTNLFDAKMFARMKKTAYFINVGRGGSVVTNDLVAALNDGVIAGAGLDVTEPEPLPTDHPLWKAKNIIITPHMSAQSDLGGGSRALIFREQLRRFVSGERLLAVVDLQKGY